MTIVNSDHPALRSKTKDLTDDEIVSPRVKKIIARMVAALKTQNDGVAIAAPQIGESLSIFVVSDKVFNELKEYSQFAENTPNAEENLSAFKEKDGKSDTPKKEHLIYINPKIIKKSKQMKLMEEGCLSVRWFYGKVKRSVKATIRAYDENGNIFERGAKGLLAQIFQHETDHLKGILFTGKASGLKYLPPDGNDGAGQDTSKNKLL